MQTIVVNYYESVIVNTVVSEMLIGSESYDGIGSALLPQFSHEHDVFYTKQFISRSNHVWKLVQVSTVSDYGKCPVVYAVTLMAHVPSSAEEFLSQTMKKIKKPASAILRPGTLVEVDYGFFQSVGKANCDVRTNKRFPDTLQKPEIHKRRLAVVVKVSDKNRVQVAPVTSGGTAADKSQFKLEEATTDKLPRYKNSNSDSTVLCGLISTVSVQRILPPASYFPNGQGKGRNTQYPVALSATERKQLKVCLLHGLGLLEYVPKIDFDLIKTQKEQFEAEVETLNAEKLALTSELVLLKDSNELAEMWARQMGVTVAGAVKEMRQEKARKGKETS